MTPASGKPPFEQFVRSHTPVLRGMALRLCRDPSDAADLVQDTLERAFRAYDQLPGDANERAWVVTILHRRFIDGCRRRRRTPPQQPLDEAQLPAEADSSEGAPAWSAITVEQVKAALAKLRPSFREVYELATMGNRSYKQIAAELNLPPATVGTRLIRARRKLRALLTPLLEQAA